MKWDFRILLGGMCSLLFSLHSFALIAPVVTNTLDSGPGSLRHELQTWPPGTTLTYAPHLDGTTITLTNGQITVTNSINVDASALTNGLTLIAGNNARHFEFIAGISNTLTGLTLTGGNLPGSSSNQRLGGGAIDNAGVLTLNACNLISNRTQNATYSKLGGAILNKGQVYLDNCKLLNNHTGSASSQSGPGGAIASLGYFYNGYSNTYISIHNSTLAHNNTGDSSFASGPGGAIYSESPFELVNSRLLNNATGHNTLTAAGWGGAIVSFEAFLIEGCNISSNSADTAWGGAIYTVPTTNNNTIRNSTLAYNSAEEGGAIVVADNAFPNALTLERCTLFGNSATNKGGGIYTFQTSPISVSLIHCSLTQNTAGESGPGIYLSSSALHLENSVISQNPLPPFSGDISLATSPTITEVGTNFIGNTNFFNVFDYSPVPMNHLLTGDAQLSPLGNFGGPTPTVIPLPGSPVINSASNTGQTVDQRGLPMVGQPDLGATEYQGHPDLAQLWPIDVSGNGLPYGIEVAFGTNGQAFATGECTNDVFEVSFGINPGASNLMIWAVERASTLTPPDFAEVYSLHGPTGAETIAPGLVASNVLGVLKICDPNPPAKAHYYRFKAGLAPPPP